MERINIYANLSQADRGQIIALYQVGLSKQDISQIVGCNRKTVTLWINKFNEGGLAALEDHRKYNTGPRKSTPEQDEDIIMRVIANPFDSVEAMPNNGNVDISERSMRRRLNAATIRSRPAARKIELKLVHRNRRMEFARRYLNTPQEVWDAVIWMDEKTFSSAEDGRYRVWRLDGQRLNPNYVLPLAQSGRIIIGFWACMSSRGLLRLQEISPRMDAEEYVEILEEVLKPSARQIFPEEEFPTIKIVQDNSGVHSSRLVQAWFDVNPDFERIPWPAKSPDLNVIENVWAKMKTSWIAGQLRTKEALRIHVHNVWNELSLEPNFTRNLVNSMQRRLQLVLESNGFWIPYWYVKYRQKFI